MNRATKRLIVVHFEDEPWDVTYILKGLREIVSDPDREDVVLNVKLNLGKTAPGDFPSRSSLTWDFNHCGYEIIYWFVESEEQLKDVVELSHAEAFIIDVVRSNSRGSGISVWREFLLSVIDRVTSVGDQVRLYTAFEVENADDEEIAQPAGKGGRRGVVVERPPIIKKGENDIYQFILDKIGWR